MHCFFPLTVSREEIGITHSVCPSTNSMRLNGPKMLFCTPFYSTGFPFAMFAFLGFISFYLSHIFALARVRFAQMHAHIHTDKLYGRRVCLFALKMFLFHCGILSLRCAHTAWCWCPLHSPNAISFWSPLLFDVRFTLPSPNGRFTADWRSVEYFFARVCFIGERVLCAAWKCALIGSRYVLFGCVQLCVCVFESARRA